jgi:hypothetical protein
VSNIVALQDPRSKQNIVSMLGCEGFRQSTPLYQPLEVDAVEVERQPR